MNTVHQYRLALATNSTSTAFTAKTPTTTAPTGSGVFNLFSTSYGWHSGRLVSRYVRLIPFGTDGNNDTYSMRLWGWNVSNDDTDKYLPTLLAQLAITLGNINATGISASTYMADTIAVTYGQGTATSPANDVPAHILVPLQGVRYLEFDWDLSGGQEAVSMNCYFAPQNGYAT